MAKKNAPVRDLPEKKIPASKADQIKGGRRSELTESSSATRSCSRAGCGSGRTR